MTPERLYLLGHILRMIVQPNDRQHPDIRKLQLTVAKLEEVTLEALSPWFADGNNPSNNHKKGYLKEIFKVATQEERFQDGRCGKFPYFQLEETKLIVLKTPPQRFTL